MENELKGFEAYFQGAKYKGSCNSDWLRGWARAERESRCGWYDSVGRPNRERNKTL